MSLFGGDEPAQSQPQFAKGQVAKGLEALRDNRPDDANLAFNRALKLNPRSALLNFLNGFAYESGAGGAGERREMAQVGYRLALQFDPNFWPAAQQLGTLALEAGDAHGAQLHFAKAAELAPDRAAPFYGLAAASYASSDLATARSALTRAEALEAPNTSDRLRVAAMVDAATGDSLGAKVMLASLQGLGDPTATAFTANRVDTLERNYTRLAQATGGAAMQDQSRSQIAISPALADRQKHMANIDVVIIQRVETVNNTRGVNLLDGLQMQFGGTLINVNSDKVTDSGSLVSDAKSLARGMFLNFPAVQYSLNIANSRDGFSRIQARPTLLAFDGQLSKFFNGAEVTYTSDGTLSSSSFNKQIGLSLEVTPTFGADGVINLKVYAELSDFSPGSAGTFKQTIQTTKASTLVSAAMTYGQTLVIAGGTSTIESKTSSGVPVLRDVPIVQNLFKSETDSTREASLLVLLTLRRPTTPQDRWTSDGPLATEDADPAALANLRSRYSSWFAQPSSLTALLSRVSSEGTGTLFRAGDVRLANPAATVNSMANDKLRDRFLDDVVTLFYY